MTIKELRAHAQKYDGILAKDAMDGCILAALDSEETVEAFDERVLSEIKRNQLRASRVQGAPAVHVKNGFTRPDGVADQNILAAASLLLAGKRELAEKSYGEKACQAAADLRITNSLSLCQRALELSGQSVPTGQNELIKASFSTLDLSNALTNSATKSLQEGFLAAAGTWREVGASRPVKNFHKHTLIQACVRDGIYPEVGAGGELKHVSAEDSAIEHSAQTRGVILTITRQMMINDDLGVIYDLERSIGINAGRTINKIFWDAVKNAGSYFTAGTNYFGSSTLSYDTISTAFSCARGLKDADGNPIAANPIYLIVSPVNEALALTLVNSMEIRDGSAATKYGITNAWQGKLQVVVEPLLATEFGGVSGDWFIGMDKNLLPGVVVSFLNGVETPTVEQVEMPIDVLGMGIRSYLDFGCDMGDTRGLLRFQTAAF